MHNAPMFMLLVGIALFVLGVGASLRLRARGGVREESRPFLAAVIVSSLGGAFVTMSAFSLFFGG